MSRDDLSIGEVVRVTGVGEATLRAWEQRYGFPTPRREPSGHRRYDADDVERIARVLADRERGIALPVAIERARTASSAVPSLYARLRARHADLHPVLMRKRHLVVLSRALEDETASRAEPAFLAASFQRERFYRASEPRWRELAAGAATCFVLADFGQLERPAGGPVEVPVTRTHPLSREWAIVCDAPGHAACLVGWEPPNRGPSTDGERMFEVLLSVEPDVVRAAAETALEIAGPAAPELHDAVRERFSEPPGTRSPGQLRLAAAITVRLLGALE
jgi:DNA-binding transcriptional MerR regulator